MAHRVAMVGLKEGYSLRDQRAEDLRSRAWGLEFRVQGLGIRDWVGP